MPKLAEPDSSPQPIPPQHHSSPQLFPLPQNSLRISGRTPTWQICLRQLASNLRRRGQKLLSRRVSWRFRFRWRVGLFGTAGSGIGQTAFAMPTQRLGSSQDWTTLPGKVAGFFGNICGVRNVLSPSNCRVQLLLPFVPLTPPIDVVLR